jgi:hypothetical protein
MRCFERTHSIEKVSIFPARSMTSLTKPVVGGSEVRSFNQLFTDTEVLLEVLREKQCRNGYEGPRPRRQRVLGLRTVISRWINSPGLPRRGLTVRFSRHASRGCNVARHSLLSAQEVRPLLWLCDHSTGIRRRIAKLVARSDVV